MSGYTTKRKIYNHHYYTVVYHDGKRIGWTRWKGTRTKGVSSNEINRNKILSKKLKKEYKGKDYYFHKDIRFVDTHIRFYNYIVKYYVNGEEHFITIADDKPLTLEEIDAAVSKLTEEDDEELSESGAELRNIKKGDYEVVMLKVNRDESSTHFEGQ